MKTENISRVIRIENTSLDDNPLCPWTPVNHEGVLSGQPRERSLEIFDRVNSLPGKFRIGIWESTAYEEQITNYDKDEYMFVLEGGCSIIEPDGEEQYFTTGDSFLMPRGFTGIWKQTEPMKKYFVMYDLNLDD